MQERTGLKIRPHPWVYFFLFGACVSADAATLFIVGDDFGLDRIFDALVATDFDVRSPLAILFSSRHPGLRHL